MVPLATPAPAEGQTPQERESTEVRALFDEGLDSSNRRSWSQAEDRFRRCLAIRRSPVIEYNLASALQAQGELVEAKRSSSESCMSPTSLLPFVVRRRRSSTTSSRASRR